MDTKILKITNFTDLDSKLTEAATLIKNGELVAFPTETVYGLGADATNADAVLRIFYAKNRPTDNPLIVHIDDKKQLSNIVSDTPESAQRLMNTFWPGPLSLVLPKHPALPAATTAGLNTVVVRYPSHPVAQSLIKCAGTPIAAPSANLSGKVSPTRAGHVIDDLMGRIPMIIDSGPIMYGLESTVVDCTTKKPIILRPGSITYEQLKEVLPDLINSTSKSPVKSPGMKYRHYATNTPLILFSGEPEKTTKKMRNYLKKIDPNKTAVIWHEGDFSDLPHNYRLPINSYEAGPLLFETMREVDNVAVSSILVQSYPWEEMGSAIMNRLEKAADEIVPC